MELCFVDDDVSGPTFDVICGIQKYAERKGKELKCELLAVVKEQMNKADEDTFTYFSEKYNNKEIIVIKCESKETLKNEIDRRLKKNYKFMVDLCLEENESDTMNADRNYKCLSMEVLGWIGEEEYHIYSSYTEDTYKIDWCRRYKTLYGHEEPIIIERECLFPSRFSEKIANSIILGGENADDKTNI